MTGLGFLAVTAAAAALYLASAVFLALACGLFLAVILEPLVAFCARRGLSRRHGAPLAVALLLVVIAGAVWGCWQPLAAAWRDLPKYEEKLRALSAQVERRLRKLESRSGLAPKDEQGRSMQTVNVAGGENSWGRLLWKTTGSFLQAVGVAVFVPFLSGYALIEKDALLAAAHGLGWTPPLALSSARMIRAYFLGLLAAFGGLAAAQTLLFAALRLENPLGLGLLTAFANILPVIGLPVAVVLASGQALLQVEGLAPYLILAAGLSALHVLASTVVLPRFVGTQLRLGALASTLALLFWGWLWGALGFLLALPLTGLALLALEAHPRSRPYAALLAAKGS